jgi:hypothetical protein
VAKVCAAIVRAYTLCTRPYSFPSLADIDVRHLPKGDDPNCWHFGERPSHIELTVRFVIRPSAQQASKLPFQDDGQREEGQPIALRDRRVLFKYFLWIFYLWRNKPMINGKRTWKFE